MSDEFQVISLEEATRRLGENVLVALEPGEQWVFDPATGRSRRADGRFFDIRPFDRGTFWQLGIYEEPTIPDPEADQPRIIGNVKLSVNPRGFVKSRLNRDLDGEEFREAILSSLSNPEVVSFDEAAVISGFIKVNPQRIGGGYIRVFRVEEEFPDSDGVTAEELVMTHDGRTLSAMRKLGL